MKLGIRRLKTIGLQREAIKSQSTIRISAYNKIFLKNNFFSRQEKAKAVEGKKTFISLIVLLNFQSLVSTNTLGTR